MSKPIFRLAVKRVGRILITTAEASNGGSRDGRKSYLAANYSTYKSGAQFAAVDLSAADTRVKYVKHAELSILGATVDQTTWTDLQCLGTTDGTITWSVAQGGPDDGTPQDMHDWTRILGTILADRGHSVAIASYSKGGTGLYNMCTGANATAKNNWLAARKATLGVATPIHIHITFFGNADAQAGEAANFGTNLGVEHAAVRTALGISASDSSMVVINTPTITLHEGAPGQTVIDQKTAYCANASNRAFMATWSGNPTNDPTGEHLRTMDLVGLAEAVGLVIDNDVLPTFDTSP